MMPKEWKDLTQQDVLDALNDYEARNPEKLATNRVIRTTLYRLGYPCLPGASSDSYTAIRSSINYQLLVIMRKLEKAGVVRISEYPGGAIRFKYQTVKNHIRRNNPVNVLQESQKTWEGIESPDVYHAVRIGERVYEQKPKRFSSLTTIVSVLIKLGYPKLKGTNTPQGKARRGIINSRVEAVLMPLVRLDYIIMVKDTTSKKSKIRYRLNPHKAYPDDRPVQTLKSPTINEHKPESPEPPKDASTTNPKVHSMKDTLNGIITKLDEAQILLAQYMVTLAKNRDPSITKITHAVSYVSDAQQCLSEIKD